MRGLDQIKIVTDSSADIPAQVAEELGITVVPLAVIFGGRSYEDGTLTHDEFWRLARGPDAPQTSQPPRGVFERAYRQLVDAGHRVLCITLTSHHSGTFSCAWSAAEEFGDRVVVEDSRALSLGHGWQVIRAARMALQGASMDAILDKVRAMRKRTHFFIEFDSIHNLRHGGRASKLMPAIDRLTHALNLKVLINLVDGELKILGVARSYQKGIERIKEEVARLEPLEHLAVGHTRRPDAGQRLADDLAALVRVARRDILVFETGSVISCHAGEGLIAAVAVQAG